jgi:hypothetical protein
MRYLLGAVLAIGLAFVLPARTQTIALPTLKAWSGDFDGMLKRCAIRVLVPFSKTGFYIKKGEMFGIDAEFGEELEQWLNKRHPLKPYSFTLRSSRRRATGGCLTSSPARATWCSAT